MTDNGLAALAATLIKEIAAAKEARDDPA